MADELITFSEAADYVDVTMITLTELCKQRHIESVETREDGAKLYRKADFEPLRAEAAGQPVPDLVMEQYERISDGLVEEE